MLGSSAQKSIGSGFQSLNVTQNMQQILASAALNVMNKGAAMQS
jgi:hypothetical protein